MSRRTITSILLVAPLGIFLLVNFLAPIALMLSRAVTERELPGAWPATAQAMRDWDGKDLPGDEIVATLVRELAASRSAGSLSAVANRLNHAIPGMRSLLFNTARALPLPEGRPPLEALAAVDERWARRQTWAAIRQAAGPYTSFYLLAALDRRVSPDGEIVRTSDGQAVFIDLFLRTFWISAVVTALCVLLGYPVAYLLATLPDRLANPLLILVLLPFWTSVLVRTAAWMVLLQERGAVNGALLASGLVDEPLRLIYNRTGVYVAMTHVLLPYFVLPLRSVMKSISPATMRAALSLGATPMRALWKVYVPQTLPGVAAGALIVFILALGYYITPALVGGADDQMISYFIAFYTSQSLNWGMAAALSLVLLVATLALVTLYGRNAGLRRLALR